MRKYTDQKIPGDKLKRILEAVQQAPSWVNFQPWEVVVVDAPETKEALQQCVPESNPGRESIVQAPLVLVFCGRRNISGFLSGKPSTIFGDWVMFDLGIATQNACLAARAEGLGSLHLGLLDHAKAAEILHLPEDVSVYELVPIGFPGRRTNIPSRKAIAEFTHHNRFGQAFDE
jgi:nitroreductase